MKSLIVPAKASKLTRAIGFKVVSYDYPIEVQVYAPSKPTYVPRCPKVFYIIVTGKQMPLVNLKVIKTLLLGNCMPN